MLRPRNVRTYVKALKSHEAVPLKLAQTNQAAISLGAALKLKVSGMAYMAVFPLQYQINVIFMLNHKSMHQTVTQFS
jgi:hypothetical protein